MISYHNRMSPLTIYLNALLNWSFDVVLQSEICLHFQISLTELVSFWNVCNIFIKELHSTCKTASRLKFNKAFRAENGISFGTTLEMFSLFGLSRTMQGLLNRRDSKIASLVSLVAVAVRAITGHFGSRDLNSWSLANHTLKAAYFWLLGCSLERSFSKANFFYRSLSLT